MAEYTPDERMIIDAYGSHVDLVTAHSLICSCGEWEFTGSSERYSLAASESFQQHRAQAVLAALAGRLLPAGGETEVLWGRWSPVGILPCDRSDAAGCANQPQQHHTRTVTTFPDGSVYTSAWRPVDE